jgi:GT2 family glycosyltransferase
MAKISVIIVTNNSEPFLHKAIDSLQAQTLQPHQVILVDTGSKTKDYLLPYQKIATILFETPGAGFCRGNNTGYKAVSKESEFVFFLNPDAFVGNDFLQKAVSTMRMHPNCGALTGQTLGWDIQNDRMRGTYDTTGIFPTWYGKWYDRDQGEPVGKAFKQEEIPAICGAVFFCRKSALDKILLRGAEVFDNTFFMYKEDIDLSLRLQMRGYTLLFIPDLIAYHCRGWSRKRREVPRIFRLCSAKNEWRIHWKTKRFIPFFYSSLKYLFVKCFNQ